MKISIFLAVCLLVDSALAYKGKGKGKGGMMMMMGKGKGKGKGKGGYAKGYGRVGSVQLGSRPFWLVDHMKESFLKKELGTFIVHSFCAFVRWKSSQE